MQAEQQSEREAFIAWIEKEFPELDVRPHRDGGFLWATTQTLWQCWQARAALSHPSTAQGWQPIETCPMDTMVILGPTKRMTGPCIGMHHSRDGWVTETPSEWASIYPPKEWMPLDLPAPPEQGGKG